MINFLKEKVITVIDKLENLNNIYPNFCLMWREYLILKVNYIINLNNTNTITSEEKSLFNNYINIKINKIIKDINHIEKLLDDNIIIECNINTMLFLLFLHN